MIEVAFKVVKGSKFYNDYFNDKEERNKFHKLTRDFLKNNGFSLNRKYMQSKRLHMELTEQEKETYSSQLLKHCDTHGLYVFKLKSIIQNKWEEEVYNKIDHSKHSKTEFWWSNFIINGSYALWDYNGDIYGYLKDEYKDSIKLSDDMEEIKMSEYYRVLEEIEIRREIYGMD